MRQLRYAGPGEDAAHVVVEALDTPDRFTLLLDDALRAAARQELPRPGRAEDETVALSPRDIQTRVRAGASPEAVAQEADLPLEKVMRFAFPVLQERTRVADEARRARPRQADGTPDPSSLGESVDAAFAGHGIDPADVAWDSFRRLDGQWTVTAGWCEDGAERFAQWSFTLAHRTVSPLDDPADDLQHGRPPRPPYVEPAPDDGWGEVTAVAGEQADPAGMPMADEATYPTGPMPVGLRLAPAQDAGPAPDAADTPVDPFAGAPWPADPLPRGLHSFFDPARPPAAHPATGVVELVGPDEPDPFATDPDEPPLPFTFEPRSAAERTATRRRAGRHAQNGAAGPATDDDAKAARARIPSWDDILLGVRRRGD